MKYKNALAINQHVCGTRVVGPYQVFELSHIEEQDLLVRHLLAIKHIVPHFEPAASKASEEKLNLTPVVDQIEQAVEGTVISDVEQVIEEEINRALHVNAVVTPTSVQVNVPIGEAAPSEATPVESSDKTKPSTETEVGTSKPKPKTAKKKSSLKDELN